MPVRVAGHLAGHEVRTTAQQGWDRLRNGALLDAATGGFDVFVTCEQGILHPQNLAARGIAVAAVDTTSWPVIRTDPSRIARAVGAAPPGSYAAVSYPRPPLKRRPYQGP